MSKQQKQPTSDGTLRMLNMNQIGEWLFTCWHRYASQTEDYYMLASSTKKPVPPHFFVVNFPNTFGLNERSKNMMVDVELMDEQGMREDMQHTEAMVTSSSASIGQAQLLEKRAMYAQLKRNVDFSTEVPFIFSFLDTQLSHRLAVSPSKILGCEHSPQLMEADTLKEKLSKITIETFQQRFLNTARALDLYRQQLDRLVFHRVEWVSDNWELITAYREFRELGRVFAKPDMLQASVENVTGGALPVQCFLLMDVSSKVPKQQQQQKKEKEKDEKESKESKKPITPTVAQSQAYMTNLVEKTQGTLMGFLIADWIRNQFRVHHCYVAESAYSPAVRQLVCEQINCLISDYGLAKDWVWLPVDSRNDSDKYATFRAAFQRAGSVTASIPSSASAFSSTTTTTTTRGNTNTSPPVTLSTDIMD